VAESSGNRVLVVSEHVLGNAGYVDDVVAYLRDVRNHSVDLEIVRPSTTWRRWWAAAQIPKARLYDLDFSAARWHFAYSAEARACVNAALRRSSYDRLFVHTQNVALGLSKAMEGIDTIVSGDATNIQLAAMGWNARGRFTRFTWLPSIRAEKKAYAAARYVTKWSQWATGSVLRDYGIDSRKVLVIPPYVPTAPAYVPRDGDRTRLLFVGNAFVRKGGTDVVKAFLDSCPKDCELHVVSNGRVEIPRHPRIHLHRDLGSSDGQLTSLYQTNDVFVFPTTRDISPLVVREAMANGLPVITTALAGIPEMVDDGRTGILIPPGDGKALVEALGRLLGSAAMREDYGRAAMVKAATMNQEALAGRELIFA